MNVKNFFKHKDYLYDEKTKKLEYDVALIELETEIRFDRVPNISPVSLFCFIWIFSNYFAHTVLEFDIPDDYLIHNFRT